MTMSSMEAPEQQELFARAGAKCVQVVCLCACVCGCEVVWLRAYAGAGAYLVRLGVVKVVWAGQENARQEALAEAIGRGLVEGGVALGHRGEREPVWNWESGRYSERWRAASLQLLGSSSLFAGGWRPLGAVGTQGPLKRLQGWCIPSGCTRFNESSVVFSSGCRRDSSA